MMPDMPHRFEIGVFTFGDHGPDPVTGATVSPAERMRQIVEEAVASTTAPTSSSRRRRWRWPRSPPAPTASA